MGLKCISISPPPYVVFLSVNCVSFSCNLSVLLSVNKVSLCRANSLTLKFVNSTYAYTAGRISKINGESS